MLKVTLTVLKHGCMRELRYETPTQSNQAY
jgi:hypothetical protein